MASEMAGKQTPEMAPSIEKRKEQIEFLANLFDNMPSHMRTTDVAQEILEKIFSVAMPEEVKTLTAEKAHENTVKRRVQKIKEQIYVQSGCKLEIPTFDFESIEAEVETYLKEDGFKVDYILKIHSLGHRQRMMVITW